jgi:mutator protein MutT
MNKAKGSTASCEPTAGSPPATSFVQVAAGLVLRDGRYLIAKRKAGVHLEGLWEFPGGKREAAESIEDCLHRELREECGIEINDCRLVEVIRHAYPEKTVELHFFQCRIVEGEPQALGCAELAWACPAELGAYDFPPADRPVVEALKTGAYGI